MHLHYERNARCREAAGLEMDEEEEVSASAVAALLRHDNNLDLDGEGSSSNVDEEMSQNSERRRPPPVAEVEFEEETQSTSTSTGDNVDATILSAFNEYVSVAESNFAELSKEEIAGVKLLDIMFKKRAPLNAYEDIQRWRQEFSPPPPSFDDQVAALYSTGAGQVMVEADVTRQHLMKKLYRRYNLSSPFKIRVTLPHSRAQVKVVCNSFKDMVVSLLTDPRINPNTDYIFHNDDPFASPPKNPTYVEDINDGRAHIDTHYKLIEEGSDQVLLGIPFYMDAAVTGQYDHLPVKALKFTLGIFNKKTRDKEYAWRILGYITHFVKEDTTGRQMYEESGHMDAGMDDPSSCDDSDVEEASTALESVVSSIGTPSLDDKTINSAISYQNENSNDSSRSRNSVDTDNDSSNSEETEATAVKAQDLHTQMETILEHSGFLQVQRTGFAWNLNYKGQILPVTFKLYVPFIKGDTDEHDRHCGSYTSRGQNVAQLCRYCQCPNEDTDNPTANYPLKTKPMIQQLVDAGDLDGLQMLSQQYIRNAWYDVLFGLHNEMGVHGACPSEMLHALLLGWFKYVRHIFFAQTGLASQLSDLINALAKQYGKFFRHQSDRNKPRTNFAKGIKKGKLMAREYTGLLLILLAVLRSTAGREAMLDSRNRNFSEEEDVQEWVMLIERLLGWECWLRQKKMSVKEVKRSRRKHQYILALFKKIANRLEGMGLRLMKFHVVLHMYQDILWFGPPDVVDTGSNESHHKSSKTAAKQTQKNARRFDFQTATRLTDNLAIELALCEINEGLKTYEYYLMEEEEDSEVEKAMEAEDDGPIISNEGTAFRFSLDKEIGAYTYVPHKSRSKYRNTFTFDTQLVEYIGNIFDQIADMNHLIGFSVHKRNNQTFRAHPNFRGEGVWQDWVMIDWGRPFGIQPAHIWTFLDFNDLPTGTNIDLGEGMRLNKAGVYAVVESALPVEDSDEVERSQFFLPYKKVTQSLDPLRRQFYLVDVDSFAAPACVVPDMGGDPDAFLRMQPMTRWLELYSNWLRSPHENIRDILPEEEEEVSEPEEA